MISDLQRSYRLGALVLALLLANVVLVSHFVSTGSVVPWLMTSLFAVLAVFAELRPIEVPSGGSFAATSMISLGCLWVLGPLAAASVETIAVVTVGVLEGNRILKVTFNVFQASVSLLLAGWVFALSGGVPGFGDYWPIGAAFLSSITYFSINSLLVSAAIALTEERPLWSDWIEDLSRTWTFCLVLGITGFALATIVVDRGLYAMAMYFFAIASFWVIFEHHKKLFRYQLLAETDELTGLFNYRQFRAELEDPTVAKAREYRKMALIMLDLDDFKQVNDQFGHEVGNLVLQSTASVIRKSTRGNDLLFRFGGEEFCILLPGTSKESALSVAERIRNTLEADLCQAAPCLRGLKVTASFGVASFPDDAPTVQDLLALADNALYKAKFEGKNMVCTVA